MKIIIGGSGYIGSNLCRNFYKKGELLVGTYYHNSKKGLEYFDLSNPDLRNLDVDLKRAKEVFICSSICKIDECKADEKKSYKVNVEGSKRIISQCFDLGLFPIFFSSDYVFNGEKGNYTEEDETNPCTAYGAHKKIIEDFLFKSGKNFLIARLSKVYGTTMGDRTYFNDITERLKNGESLRQATDQKLTPTHIDDLVNVLDISIQMELNGLYNLVASGIYSRFQLASLVKSKLKISSGEIIPCSIKDFRFLDNRPLDTGLINSKITKRTGYKFTSVEEALQKLKTGETDGIRN